MKHKVAELEGPFLDLAVAMAEGLQGVVDGDPDSPVCRVEGRSDGDSYAPSLVRDIGGPIIDRQGIELWCGQGVWHARKPPLNESSSGPTALVAAMRAYIVSKFGETIDLPLRS